jgi:hypothetical protein
MKGFVGFLVGALALVLVGVVLLGVSRYEEHLADAQQLLATRELGRSREALAAAASYAGYVRWLPGIGARAVQDVRAREASLQYWERKYDALVATKTDAIAGEDAENTDLQLVIANAGFRAAQDRLTDRASAMIALEEAMNGYLAVLRNAAWSEDAAHNFEYVARLRQEMARGQRPQQRQESQDSAQGQQGAPAADTKMEQFEIYIPLESEERPLPGDAGKSTPNQRKG